MVDYPEFVELRERVKRLEQMLGQDIPVPEFVKLSSRELLVFRLLMARELLSVEGFATVAYGDSVGNDLEKCLSVFIHKLRKKLLPHNVLIETLHGQGYRLKSSMKARINQLMGVDP